MAKNEIAHDRVKDFILLISFLFKRWHGFRAGENVYVVATPHTTTKISPPARAHHIVQEEEFIFFLKGSYSAMLATATLC